MDARAKIYIKDKELDITGKDEIVLELNGVNNHLKVQIDYVNRFYNWNAKSISWTRFLQGALNAK